METSEKLLKHKNLLEITFGTFKKDVDNITDDTKHIIVDVEEIVMILSTVIKMLFKIVSKQITTCHFSI